MQFDVTSPPHAAPQSEGALGPYLRAIRVHKWLVALLTLATLAASIAWLSLRSPSYEASAEVLVSPLSQDDVITRGLDVIRDTPGEPTRAVQTAATLLESPSAARAAASSLGADWTTERVLMAVEVQPQGQSNILAITAAASDPDLAARVANEFTRAALQVRNEPLEAEVDGELARLQEAQASAPPDGSEAGAALADRILQLEAISEEGDPTLALTEPAEAPSSATGPAPPLILALALLGGFSLGAGAAVLRELLDRAVRDESEAISLYPLAVLARIPILARRERKVGKEAAWYMPSSVREAFRTLIAQVADGSLSGRILMVTSATTGDGKTTSAVNLAVSLVASGRSTVLLDFDLRKPDVGAKLGLPEGQSLLGLLDAGSNLRDMTRAVPHVPGLSVLSAGTQAADPALVEVLHARLPEIIAEARELADYVVVDTAPLGEVSDALRILHAVDDVVVVVRPGSTARMSFEMMRDLLQRRGQTPLGMLMIGDVAGLTSGYYGQGAARRDLFTREPVS